MRLLSAVSSFAQLLGFHEVAIHSTPTHSLRIVSNVILSAIETQLKLVAPWLVASAIALPDDSETDIVLLGIPCNFHHLLLAASVIQLSQRYLPECRKWIVFGISETISERQALAVLSRALDLATQANALPLSQLTTTLSKQLCTADLHPQLLLSSMTEQVYPALLDMAGGLVYSTQFFSIETTAALLGYMGANLIVNYLINRYCDLAPQKNRLMLLQNRYHTQSYALLRKAITIELHQRRDLELDYLHSTYTDYRSLKQSITQLERIPALQHLCVIVVQWVALGLLYLHHLNTLPTEQTVFLFIYLGSLSAQFASLSSGWRSVTTSSHALAELRHFLDTPDTSPKRGLTWPWHHPLYQPLLNTEPDVNEQIEHHPIALQMQRVSFWYDIERPLLVDISVEIARGSTTAFVGSSHCGKSTLTRLALGLITPSNFGQLTLFGRHADQFTKQERYRLVYLVTQEADEGVFEEESVAYNVLYAHCSDEELRALKGNPQLLEDSRYQTLQASYLMLCQHAQLMHIAYRADCRGLSGGEKQRIKIARALASQAPIVILDEATSQLDARTEAEVLQQVSRCLEGRTLIFISHKLSSIRHCQQILVFRASSSGTRLVEAGTHTQLLAQPGEYASLWNLQYIQ